MSMREIGGKLLENINKEPIFYRTENNSKPIWELAAVNNKKQLEKRYVRSVDSTGCV